MHRKQVETAMTALCALTEAWPAGRRLSASDLAESRGLSSPSVAKTLNALAHAGMVAGAPGPGGGYVLARDPGSISLHDILHIFEREDAGLGIPFARLLDRETQAASVRARYRAAREALETLLTRTSLEDVCTAKGENGTHRGPPLEVSSTPPVSGDRARMRQTGQISPTAAASSGR